MTEKTQGIIYAIKKSDRPWNEAVAEYMAKYSGSFPERYSEYDLYRILKVAFIDFISTCDKPDVEVRALLESIERDGACSMAHRIAGILDTAKVKENGKYVNGFGPDEGEELTSNWA